ncbi:sulfite exporter TauE/SafE family protein [Galbibacter mesophilus]|uniref:sulfite exporter TauE/SafE family protein n=1 Tax=Galbibacter mesophilus TaxID=379069 RepID=UPI00191D7F92|nr:sulfite exporter TauE/SafE family protein [Galbibacter mesophilus]MCM5664210.1 sulfite exporter TauE/SafE family protein [Galbibacter mesophilus]
MWVSAFILGLLGSFHCIGMCGPIAFLLPLSHDKPVKKGAQIFIYHLGRILTYAFVGFLFGWIGKGLFISGMQQRLSIVIGVLIVSLALIPLRNNKSNFLSRKLMLVISKAKSALGKQLKKKKASALFSIGLLNGLLPCGLVYMALFTAIALGNPHQSSLYMVFFGLGTIPLMTTAVYLGNFLSISARRKITKAIPVFVVLIGLLFIVRGLGLGIPYLSPSDLQLMVKATPNCVVPVAQ